MSCRILVPLAEGFEEIEAVTVIDVLRRAELDVTVAGIGPAPVTGSRGVRIEPDASFDQVDPEAFDALVLPGGMGGTLAMMEDERLVGALREHHRRGRLTAAICAAPMVLAAAGIAGGHALTSHPSVRDRLGEAEVRDAPRVVRSGNVVTSQGPGTALEFALELVEELCGADVRARLAEAMVVAQSG